jgi:shikimate dehydrogenase
MIRGAVLGSPIEHSLSPVLHRAAFVDLQIEGSYDRIEVGAGELKNFLSERGSEFDYLSLTMPLKEEVLQLGFATSDLALKSQSANTLIKSDGSWSATSTDGTGFLQALAHRGFSDFSSVLILGAGGTSRAIAAALDGVADSITVLGRTSTREESFNEIVTESQFSYVMWSNAFSLEPFSLVVNTTPAGAADLLAEGIDGGITSLLFDVIYKPWPTVLAKKWSNVGAPVISGLELLLYQGIDQLRLVSAKDFDTEELASTLREKLSSAR